MPLLASFLLWFLIGVGTCLLHLLLLRRSLDRTAGLHPAEAGRRVRKGLPLRLLALAPVLLVVARAGLVACIGWTAGSLLTRWLVAWHHARTGNPFAGAMGGRG